MVDVVVFESSFELARSALNGVSLGKGLRGSMAIRAARENDQNSNNNHNFGESKAPTCFRHSSFIVHLVGLDEPVIEMNF